MTAYLYPFLSLLVGALLFFESLFLAITGYSNQPTTLLAARSSVAGSSIEADQIRDDTQELAAQPEAESAKQIEGSDDADVLGANSTAPAQINSTVFSTIRLKYQDRTRLLKSSDIQFLLGNANNINSAKLVLDSMDPAKIGEYVSALNLGWDQQQFQVNSDGVNKDSVAGFQYYQDEYGPDWADMSQRIYEILTARVASNSGESNSVLVRSMHRPGTNGSYAAGKYIELDHSEQKIYAWEDGKLYNSWSVSGFYDRYAVYGVFTIQNKSVKAWSNFASKWMPYWMAYHYDPKQNTMFGIHELVYWYDEAGNYIEESSSSIGFQKSGGCVRLDRGEMVKLFEWSEVGIPFLIHE